MPHLSLSIVLVLIRVLAMQLVRVQMAMQRAKQLATGRLSQALSRSPHLAYDSLRLRHRLDFP